MAGKAVFALFLRIDVKTPATRKRQPVSRFSLRIDGHIRLDLLNQCLCFC